MAELESVLEKRLIDQLCYNESQWTTGPISGQRTSYGTILNTFWSKLIRQN